MNSAQLAKKLSFSKLRFFLAAVRPGEFPFCPVWDRQLNAILDLVDAHGWDHFTRVGGTATNRRSGTYTKNGVAIYYHGSPLLSGEAYAVNSVRLAQEHKRHPSRKTLWRFFKSVELYHVHTPAVTGVEADINAAVNRTTADVQFEECGDHTIVTFPSGHKCYISSTDLTIAGIKDKLIYSNLNQMSDFVTYDGKLIAAKRSVDEQVVDILKKSADHLDIA